MALAASIAIAERINQGVVKELEAADREGRKAVDPRQGNPNFDAWVDHNREKGRPVDLIQSNGGPTGPSPLVKSQIHQFVHSDICRNYAGKGTSAAFEAKLPAEYKHLDEMAQKAAGITTISDLRDQMTTTRLEGIVPLPVRENRLRAIHPNYPTTSSAIKYPRETGFTNNAAGRPHNDDPASTTASSQSSVATTIKTAVVETVDHHVPVSLELFEDAPALIAYLEGRLEDGLDDNEDAMIVSGAGTGSNEYLGYFTDSDVPAVLWSGGDVGDNQADCVLNAMIALWAAEYEPEKTVLPPAIAGAIMKMKDANGNYLNASAHLQSAKMMLWGYPVIRTTAVSATKGLVGAFSRAAALWTRLLLEFRMTDSHDDKFIEGMIYILARRRAALTIFRPESFRELTFDAAPT